jgi:hypothetical protein
VGTSAHGCELSITALPAGKGVADRILSDQQARRGAEFLYITACAQIGVREDDAGYNGCGFSGDLRQGLKFIQELLGMQLYFSVGQEVTSLALSYDFNGNNGTPAYKRGLRFQSL